MYPRKYKIVFPEIERWMQENGVSIHEISRRVGLTDQTMQNHLYGFNQFKLTTIRKLIDLTGIPFEALFSE